MHLKLHFLVNIELLVNVELTQRQNNNEVVRLQVMMSRMFILVLLLF